MGRVLNWIAIAGGLGTLFFSLRWSLRRHDALGRSIDFPKITVALLLVLSCAAAYPGIVRKREEAALGRVASVIAGVPVQVVCQTMGGAAFDLGSEAGYVMWGPDGKPEHIAHIKFEQCKLLRTYMGSGQHRSRPTRGEYAAVHVLTHEAVHTSGVMQESLTECKAVQRDAITARQLGASDKEARAVAWLYWKTIYPEMPENYRDAGCGPGGGLDEHLKTSPWVAGA